MIPNIIVAKLSRLTWSSAHACPAMSVILQYEEFKPAFTLWADQTYFTLCNFMVDIISYNNIILL